jgi:ABC-2 type transport system ATP-binding protein
MKAIVTENLTKVFTDPLRRKPIAALTDLTLEIGEGEVFGFLGHNGAGKSTAIKLFVNLIFPTSGRVTIFGQDVSDPRVRAKVGYLPENPYLYDHLTAEELLRFGARVSDVGTAAVSGEIDRLLRLVDLMHARTRALRTYSKGMLQRAGLALALVGNPRVVILDEPMSGLDPLGRHLVADVIRRLHDEGRTVFFSTHILPDVEHLCDRVGIIAGGALRYVGSLVNREQREPNAWIVTVVDLPKPLETQLLSAGTPVVRSTRTVDICVNHDTLYVVLELLKKENVGLQSMVLKRESLEEIFLRETAKSQHRAE